MKHLPAEVPDLIESLEKQFPPRCIDPNEPLEQHLRYAGAVDLVKELRARFEATEKVATKRALQST